MPVQISIVVCTHRRFALFESAILSFCQQTAAKDLFEIVVVDNDLRPNQEVQSIATQAQKKIDLVYIHEPVLGLSQARNTGGKAAKASYIGYMDDDAKAPPDYIEKAIDIMHRLEPDIFGGPYLPYYITKKPAWFSDAYETGESTSSTGYLDKKEFLNGTNMIYKRKLLVDCGWFDTGFGMSGKKISYGEETAIQMKARDENPGLKVYYDTELFVYHLVPDVKLKLKDKYTRKYNIGKSQAYIWIEPEQFRNVQKKAPVTLIRVLGGMFSKGIAGFIFRDRKKYPHWQNYAYENFSHYFASIGQEWRYTKDWVTNR